MSALYRNAVLTISKFQPLSRGFSFVPYHLQRTAKTVQAITIPGCLRTLMAGPNVAGNSNVVSTIAGPVLKIIGQGNGDRNKENQDGKNHHGSIHMTLASGAQCLSCTTYVVALTT